MVNKYTELESPLQVEVSFKKYFDLYREKLQSGSKLMQIRAQEILNLEKEYPELTNGIDNPEKLEALLPQIDLLLEDVFASVLQLNEIKFATLPFQSTIFKSSERYKNILKTAGDDYEPKLMDFGEDQFYIMACSIILASHFGYKLDFRRPFYYDIPDANGIVRHYRVLYNGDFISIERTENSLDVTPEDVAVLLDNYDNIELWKEKFPPNSWKFTGFVIANMYDATTDVALSDFKESLLQLNQKDDSFTSEFQSIVQTIFNLPELRVGYSIFNAEENEFEHPPTLVNVKSYVLNGLENQKCTEALCDYSYKFLLDEHKSYCISDVNRYLKMAPGNHLYKSLSDQNIQSAIITPIVSEGEVFGLIEIVSPNAQELNSINANKLEDILPFLVDAVKRDKQRQDNEIELLIQKECTSIHSSVHWKFKKEAERVLKLSLNGEEASFKEVVFEDVYPLFGQIDIKGSSEARNVATKADLVLQLEHVRNIMDQVFKIEPLPIYEQLNYRIDTFLMDLGEHLQVDSERRVLSFLRNEIVPLYDHLSSKSPDLKALVNEYYSQLDTDKGFIYRNRRDYDESVMLINRTMADVLDKKQIKAQGMYPHYYERFKTDGVEHNLYIGESITKDDSFNKIYLYNLRLWQLQAMCEMENKFYKLKEKLTVPLDAASMILAFNSSLSLRFRMDEKRFDVDGTYNARYEVVKKRVDKALVKGTDERITQPGKITVVYSQKSDEIEYLKYVHFLQSKKQLGEAIEILDLEDLQGVTGLKAIRVNVLYNRGKKDKEYYTYEDLMTEISK